MAREVAAAAIAFLIYSIFGTLLRGFAGVAAVRLMLRRGARAFPDAVVLVMLPSLFGCLLMSELLASTIKLIVSGRRRTLATVRRASLLASALGDTHNIIGNLPSRLMFKCTWAPTSGSAAHSHSYWLLHLASSTRNWLLLSVVVAILSPFAFPGNTFSRMAIGLWILIRMMR